MNFSIWNFNNWKSLYYAISGIIMLSMISFIASGQQKYTLSGYVKDAGSGESLIGASIYVQALGQGVYSNTYGFYSLTLPSGDYVISCSFIGYQAQVDSIHLYGNQQLNINLASKSITTKEVVVTDARKDENVNSTEMNKVQISSAQLKTLPVLLGEADPLKTIQLLPGVQSGEGSTGLYIRGGGPDQNLILLDDATVYNTGHLFGFFSVFNADAIKNVTLIKGGMPANYGGRLSSVVNVDMKEGNNKSFHGEGGIGLIASRLSLEGPLVKNKASFIVSARRTYIDLLVKPFVNKSSSFAGSGYYFYDLNTKINYNFSDKDHLFLSGYFGRDVFTFKSSERTFSAHIPWGNATATLRWNHLFNQKLFANTALIYNAYNFAFGATQNSLNFKLSSGIKDWNFKTDFDYYLNLKHHIKFGGEYIYHTFEPSTASGQSGDMSLNPDNPLIKYAHEAALYALDDYTISDKIKINFGLRYSFFQQVGPYTRYEKDTQGNITDSTVYKSLEPVKTYGGLEPRIILRYGLANNSSIKASVTKNYQFIHLVTSAATTLPTDLWVPSTYKVKPQIGWQYSAGYFRNFNDNIWETSLEGYYKTMSHQIEFEQGYTPSLADPEDEFVFGKGWSYGAELYIHKQKGRLTGWIGYTLSWTWRKFADLNNDEKYPAKYDRRHDLNIVASYKLNDRWTLSSDFVFASGNSTTLPQSFYFTEGVLTQEYGNINDYRLQPYNRLDFSAIYKPKANKGRKFKTSWAFSVYNVYSRQNPFFIYFDQSGDYLNGSLEIQAKKVSIFPVIPAVTWNFKW